MLNFPNCVLLRLAEMAASSLILGTASGLNLYFMYCLPLYQPKPQAIATLPRTCCWHASTSCSDCIASSPSALTQPAVNTKVPLPSSQSLAGSSTAVLIENHGTVSGQTLRGEQLFKGTPQRLWQRNASCAEPAPAAAKLSAWCCCLIDQRPSLVSSLRSGRLPSSAPDP